MITKRLVLLVLGILGVFSLIFILPKQLGYQPVGIALELPEFLGPWWGHEGVVTQEEIETLGRDTRFARKDYQNGSGDAIHTSIVLAGQDMMTGIHRPERCLYAQGWTTGSSSLQTIDVPGFGKLQATRLQIWRKDPRLPADGDPAHIPTIRSVAYYWFVGCAELAATHEQRLWIDMRDRLFHGFNQRWAMVMLFSEITGETHRFGRNEKQTDEVITGFAKQLAPKILLPTLKRNAWLEIPTEQREPEIPEVARLALSGRPAN